MIDLLTYMLPDPAWALEHHLAVAGAGQPLYIGLDEANKRIWEIKGANGFPWDTNSFDENYVYQVLTEGPNGWTDPHSFKMFDPPIIWTPRYITPGQFLPPNVSPSTYRTYSSCSTFTTANLGGTVETSIEGPYSIDFGGDLGVQSALVQKYKWGTSLEVNYYVQGFGHVEWQLWTLGTSGYALKQTSLFNTLVAGGVPALNAPCGVATL